MFKPALLALGAAILAPSLLAQTVLTVSRDDALLRTVDPFSGTTLSSVTMTDPTGRSINGANGLTEDVAFGRLWAIVKFSGGVRELVTVDATTGAVTPMSVLPDNFSNLAFDLSTLTLFGVTGDGASNPEQLWAIDTTTFSATVVMALGNGTDGESIAAHPTNGTIYHASGYSGTRNVDRIFETVDVANTSTSQITMFGYDEDEILSMAFWAEGSLLACDLDEELIILQENGAVTQLSTLDHSAKGMVVRFLQPSGPYANAYGGGCPGTGGYTPWLGASGVPSPGQPVGINLANTFGGAPAVALIGLGNQSVPFAGCTIDVLPLLPVTAILPNAGVGASAGRGTFTIPIGPTTPPIDVYFQAVLADNGVLVFSNSVQLHIQ